MSDTTVIQKITVTWFAAGRKATGQPDPSYPRGIFVDGSHGATKTCEAKLPYPATGCGTWLIKCTVCGLGVAISAAGRADDPHGVRLPCKR